MYKYKRCLDIGDIAISRSTAFRYKLKTDNLRNSKQVEVEDCRYSDYEGDEMDTSVFQENMQNNMPLLDNELYNPISYINKSAEDDMQRCLNEILLDEIFARSTEKNKKPKTLLQFMKSIEFCSKVKTPVDKTPGEIFLMILKLSTTYSLPVTVMTQILQLVNNIFEQPILPESKYDIDELLNPNEGTEFHAVCHNCSVYIGKFKDVQNLKLCPACHIDLDLSNPSNASYFVLIDPSVQIADLLHVHARYYNDVVSKSNNVDEFINDVHDGDLYRIFVNELPIQDKQNYLTAILNTDGAPKFKCSKYSIWPIYLLLNELPIQDRMSNLITCGLWFHKKKPDMCAFLDPLIDLFNNLSTKGINCVIQNKKRNVKLFITSCCVDSVARAPIQGIMQFNGHFGCNWCYHPGIYAKGSMRYPTINVDLRDDKFTVTEMLNINPNFLTNGIKYPSPMINIDSFKIVSGFVPDYMHCCLEGVAKQLVNYYAPSMSKNQIEMLDSIMSELTVPNQISRFSRPFSARDDWKAREWENFLLYYSIPLFKLVLSNKLFHHWSLLSEAVYILLKDRIHVSDLNRANTLLQKFVFATETLFGIKAMTFNVHQLLHICDSVFNFGPLWAHSTYCFESANQQLLKAIKCAKGVPQQISRYTKVNHSVKVLQDFIYPTACEIIKRYCSDILEKKTMLIHKYKSITYFGKAKQCTDELILHLRLSKNAVSYDKIVKDGCLYECLKVTKRRSNNSFAQLLDGRYIQICKFILDEETQKEITIFKQLQTTNLSTNFCEQQQIVVTIEEENRFILSNNIKKVCVFMKVCNKAYICSVPNLIHY